MKFNRTNFIDEVRYHPDTEFKFIKHKKNNTKYNLKIEKINLS